MPENLRVGNSLRSSDKRVHSKLQQHQGHTVSAYFTLSLPL